MRLERVRLQILPLRDHVCVSRVERLEHVIEPLGLGLSQGQHVPVTLRDRICRRAGGRVEDEVEPAHGFLEALVLAQPGGDEQRHVEEDFPVVEAVRAAEIEVYVMHRPWVSLPLLRSGAYASRSLSP